MLADVGMVKTYSKSVHVNDLGFACTGPSPCCMDRLATPLCMDRPSSLFLQFDEHLELKEMVEKKAAAGRRALGAWMNRCKAEVGDVGVGMFKKLMTALVDSVMLYGVEIWGCTRGLEAIEQVQMRAFRMFFGVGTLYPKVSLMMELESLPVVWEAKVRCVQFWYKVLTSKIYV